MIYKSAPIRLIKSVDGKSAYQYAQEGGYTGTEDEFRHRLAYDLEESKQWVEEQIQAAIDETWGAKY